MSAKSRRVQWRNPLLGLAVVAACVGAVVTGVSGDSDSGSAAGAAEADAAIANAEACKVDLLCMGDRDVFIAVRICRQRIEQLSDHSVRWTDGAPDGQFSRSRWRHPAHDAFTFTFVPDEAEFQFGFGVFVPIIYECDVDLDLKAVLDVRVREGRLPVRLSIHRTDLAKGASPVPRGRGRRLFRLGRHPPWRREAPSTTTAWPVARSHAAGPEAGRAPWRRPRWRGSLERSSSGAHGCTRPAPQ